MGRLVQPRPEPGRSQFVLVDNEAGDPQFTRTHGPYPTATAARSAAVAVGEDGRLGDTLWVVPLNPTFP